MSGICAILRLEGALAETEAVAPILAGLAARGPDGSGILTNGPAAIGHTLLATTPESVVEQMPLRHAGTGCLISADVRLDNRNDMIAELGLDAGSRVIGDGELILEAYLKWGMGCPEHLLGDFAFVIWDPRHCRLFAARDKVGMRQLIYHFAPGKLFACATDVTALLHHRDVPRRINERRIADFIENFEAIDDTSTFYEGLLRLPPAHAIMVEQGAIKIWRYWQLVPPPVVLRASDGEYEEAFLEVFTQAVRARLRSPDAVGSMLSGGMDSGSVSAVAARLLQQAGAPPLNTFSAIHTDPECLESQAIQLAMTIPHIDPHVVSTGAPDEFRDEVAAMIRNCAEPFDGHMAMFYALFVNAQRAGVKVMLNGGTGDTTLSAGNIVNWHLTEGRIWKAWQEAQADERFWGDFLPARRAFLQLALRKIAPRRMRDIWHSVKPLLTRGNAGRPQLLNDEFAQRIDFAGRHQQFRNHVAIANDTLPETRASRMLHPFALAGVERYDRVAGSFGIEQRDPFLDTRLVEFCLTIPVDRLKRDGWPKLILRRSMAGLLPDALRWRTGRSHVGGWYILACMDHDLPYQDEKLFNTLSAYVDENKLRNLIAGRTEDSALASLGELGYLLTWINAHRATAYDLGD